MTELKETIDLMTSSDYKDRFKAEYYQLKIRLDKLKSMCKNWDDGKLPFTPTCMRGLYDIQIKNMEGYLATLEFRARLEEIKL